MKKYEFIKICPIVSELKHGKTIYEILNNETGNYLGRLTYYPPYKKCVFEGTEGKIFANTCLRDVIDFLENEIK